jgi:AcrR family transcriptional regulator
MSKNTRTPKKKIDMRVRHTRERLGDALVELIQKKPFDTITVQDVLNRANVSRSTFYTHYRDKNDLFLSDVDDFFEGMATVLSRRNDSSERIAPVRELFAHVAEWRPFWVALVSSGRVHDVVELGQGHFALGIEQRFAELPRARGIPAKQRAAVASALAGALFSLLSWWVRHGLRESPAHMDELYHRLAWTGLRW